MYYGAVMVYTDLVTQLQARSWWCYKGLGILGDWCTSMELQASYISSKKGNELGQFSHFTAYS